MSMFSTEALDPPTQAAMERGLRRNSMAAHLPSSAPSPPSILPTLSILSKVSEFWGGFESMGGGGSEDLDCTSGEEVGAVMGP